MIRHYFSSHSNETSNLTESRAIDPRQRRDLNPGRSAYETAQFTSADYYMYPILYYSELDT